MTTPLWSDLTVTDVFCGAGGNTIGAKKAGLRVRVGLNHWERAIETYGSNNPDVDIVERVDVSLCDPRRYHSTDIAIMSPECTTHSPAGGNRHRKDDGASIWGKQAVDPATERSRVTMFDVVRFTEYHRYRVVIIENVVEATRWELFPDWLRMMDNLGYSHRILSLNSMFFHPTPQSRDRIYVVFWKKGNRAPKLEFRPPAPCGKCGCVVEGVQVWKNGRTIGKYRRQYVYACPRCATEVTPFYYAALNALDFSLAAERIGDRGKPLKPRTMDRIRYGLEKYGNRTLVVNVKQGERDSSRAWPAATRELGSVPTWDNYFGVSQPAPFLAHLQGARTAYGAAEPMAAQLASCAHDAVIQPGFLVETTQTHSGEKRARTLDREMPTQSAQQTSALVMAPFLVTAGSNESSASSLDPMPTQTATERLSVISPFLVRMRGTADEQMKHASAGVDEAVATQSAGGVHDAVIQGAAQISMRDANAMRVAPLDRELMTQGCAPQQALISKAPFLVSYYGSDQATPADAPVASITTVDRHGVVSPELRVEDCYFRMLQPHEIGAAMAFPADYAVGGNKRDKVKQYGNAVTPPTMDWIVRQCAATLAPELEGGEAA